jgi:type IV pilus assembly protein PilO
VPGLEKRSQLVIASGGFPALLGFLRRLESLSPLAVVSDLNLKHGDSPKQGEQARTTLKFSLTAYSLASPKP